MASSLKKAWWPKAGLWRHRDFLKLWAGQTVSEFGSQVTLLALPLIAILQLHASAFVVAALGMVEQLPFLLFALPAGVWVDRLARRPILIAGDVGRALTLASIPIAAAFAEVTITQLFVVGFVTGVLTVFFDVAYQSYLPSLVEREQLVEGNSKLQVSASAAQIGGPGTAGALIGALTAPYAIVADAASYVASVLFLFGIRNREHVAARRSVAEETSMKTELLEGIRYVTGNRHLRAIAACTANSNFFGNVCYAILLVYVVRRLGLTAQLIGIVVSCANIGLLIGALTAGWIAERLGVGRTILLSAAMVGPGLVLIPLSPTSFPVPLLVLSLIVFGFSGMLYNITQISLRQAITPERLQGRMNSVMRFIVWGVLPLGALLGGALATVIGLRPTLFVAAAGGALSWIPIAASPVRELQRVPEPEVTTTGPLGGMVTGVGTEGITAGPGPAPADA
jgi:MFS family permease